MWKQKINKTLNCNFFTVRLALYFKIITIINNFVGHKNRVDTCDVRIQLYWECKNTTLPSKVSSLYMASPSLKFSKSMMLKILYLSWVPLWIDHATLLNGDSRENSSFKLFFLFQTSIVNWNPFIQHIINILFLITRHKACTTEFNSQLSIAS